MDSVSEALKFYSDVLDGVKKGSTKNQALKEAGKQLTSFRRICHIYELKQTRPEKFKKVSNGGSFFSEWCACILN